MDIQLKRGLLDVCVLAAIKDEDSYGYQIIKDMKPYVEISESTLYPILRRLEGAELLTVRNAEHNGRLRKYYHITPLGLARIEEFKEEWKELLSIYEFVTKEGVEMKKNEFLLELKERLVGLSEADVKQSLDYYTEMIDDRMEDGLSEDEAVKEVGTPAAIAEEILTEMPLSKLVKARVKPKRKMAAWEIVLLILGSPLWLSMLATLIMAVFSVYLALWSVIAMLWSVELAIGLGALSGLLLLPISILQGNMWTGVVLFGMGLFFAGLSVFGFFLCLHITKGLCVLSKKLFLFIKSCFIRKEAVR